MDRGAIGLLVKRVNAQTAGVYRHWWTKSRVCRSC